MYPAPAPIKENKIKIQKSTILDAIKQQELIRAATVK